MTKVLILANKIPYPSKDGSSIAKARLLECLLEIPDMDITYGAINTVKHRKSVSDFPEEILSKIDLQTFNEDTTPAAGSAINNLLFSNKPYHTIRFFVHSVREWLNGYDNDYFDYVILEGAFMGDYLPLSRVKGKRVILRTHNLEHIIWERSSLHTGDPLKKLYLRIQSNRLRAFEERLTQMVHAVWSISPVDAFWFKSLNSNTFHIPVSIEIGDPPKEVKPDCCFHLGALDWRPNQQGLNWFIDEVWPRVLEKKPHAQFHIAGNNTPDYVKSIPSKNIVVHGRVPSAEAFAKSHGISIIPLLSGSGIRIKLLENGRYGIPCVSTRVGAEGVYNSDKSIIPLTDFPAQFATELAKLMDDPESAQKMGLAMRLDMEQRFSKSTAIDLIKNAWPE